MFVVRVFGGFDIYLYGPNGGASAHYTDNDMFSTGRECSITLDQLREAIQLIEEYKREHPPEDEEADW